MGKRTLATALADKLNSKNVKPRSTAAPVVVAKPSSNGNGKAAPVSLQKSGRGKPKPAATTLDELILDPENATLGTVRGAQVVQRSLEEYGAGRGVLADRNNTLIAGNKTVTKARELGLRVKMVDVAPDEILVGRRLDLDLSGTTEEQRKARGLALMDNASALADIKLDPQTVVSQLRRLDIKLENTGITEEAFKRFEAKAETLDKEHAKTQEAMAEDNHEQGLFNYRDDVLFPSSNQWGIPDLLPSGLSTAIPERTISDHYYGRTAEEIKEHSAHVYEYPWNKVLWTTPPPRGVLNFYCYDIFFESLWFDAAQMIPQLKKVKWDGIISPDFSVFKEMPLAVNLYNVYRSRWCARYWQEAGLPIIPSIQSCSDETLEMSITTLPKHCPVVSVQARTTQGQKQARDADIARIHRLLEHCKVDNLLIYGGDEARQWMEPRLPKKTKYHWLTSWASERRKVFEAKIKKRKEQTQRAKQEFAAATS
jgi:hypothetical protein